MRLRLFVVVLMVTAVGVLSSGVREVSAAQAAPSATAVTIPVNGTIPSVLGTFTGTATINQIVAQGGQLLATGTLTGTLVNAAGAVIGTVTNLPFQIPLTASGTCPILHLTLGPLDLNLLGLMVHLNQVVLDITAQSGPGNLLGNLLCAVAHLLDGNASLTAVANLLNHILSLLSGV